MYGVSFADPVAYGVGMGLMFLTAIVAAWLPARKAAGVDPMTALRCE